MKVEGSRAEIQQYQSIPHISVTNRMRALRWHPQGLQSWSMSDWATALAGEVGELCNIVKKLNRIRDGLPGNKETLPQLRYMLCDEVADVFLYLDLFAQAHSMNIEDCVRNKFNTTSERLGVPERL